jgi:hypothetical protein
MTTQQRMLALRGVKSIFFDRKHQKARRARQPYFLNMKNFDSACHSEVTQETATQEEGIVHVIPIHIIPFGIFEIGLN